MSPALPSTPEPTAAKNYHCALVLASCGFLALLCFLVIFLSSSHQRTESHPPLCKTEDCRAHASLLTKHINWTLDPCEDFQAFVCSLGHSSSDHGETFKTVEDGVRLSWYQRLPDMLATGSVKLPVGRKALAMYSRCRDKYPSDQPDLPPFLDFIEGEGLSWPQPPREFLPPLQLLVKFAYLWQCPFWMSVSVLGVPGHSLHETRWRVRIRPSMLVPILLYHHRITRPIYTKYWAQFLSHMYPDNSTGPANNETVVDEIRVMEEQILETLKSSVHSGTPKPAVFSFGNISAYVPSASALEWLRCFQQSIPLRRQLSSDDEIVVSDIRLLQTVSALLEKYDVGQLNMHLSWLFVQYYAPVSDYRMLVDHYGSTHTAAAYMSVFCGHHIEESYKVLIVALNQVFRFTAQDINTINDGFDDVVSTAVEKINASDWMDDDSKTRLTEKISSVKKSLWPPESIVNADLLEKLYVAFPEKAASFAAYWMATKQATRLVNMTGHYEEVMSLPWNSLPGFVVYDYVSNTVELATATIAAPMYYPKGTKAMLYGGLLFLMATHLARAFDSEGVRWTPNGTEVGNILSNASLFEYHNRELCLEGDIEHSLFPEVPAADIAYTAMKQSHARDRSVPLALRADLSEDKVFFMTLCYVSCGPSRDRHSHNFDCNKLARNSRAFANAFHCPIGSKMNPAKKCHFFAG